MAESKAGTQKRQKVARKPESLAIAKGIRTGTDFANLMSNLDERFDC
jgi:hypothetical protein